MSDSHTDSGSSSDHWRDHGVRVIPGDQLDPNTAQTPERKKSGPAP
jgi:hypothetical protein